MSQRLDILVISGAFYPANSPRSFRTTELVKELCVQGHKVTLISDINIIDQASLVEEYKFSPISLGGMKFKVLSRPKNKVLDFVVRGINRLTNLLFEYPEIEYTQKVKSELKNHSGYDLLISIAAPHPIHWGVVQAWNEKKPIAKVWVADCGDPFYANMVETYRRPIYFKYIEQKWCRKADFISIPKIELIESFLPEFKSKIIEIPQGFNIAESQAFNSIYTRNVVPTFMFAGSFVPKHRDPTMFLEFLVSLDIDFRFYIYTRNSTFVRPFIKKGNGRIILNDYVDRKTMIHLLSKMDFNVNFMYNPKYYAPSKIIDYLIADRPILNIEDTLDHELILNFLSGDYKGSFDMFSLQKFDIRNVSNQFLNLYYNSTIQ